MKKNLVTFAASWCRLFSLFGLLALMAMLPSSAGAASTKPMNVRTATVVKRATTSSQQADSDRDGLTNATEERRTRTNPRKFDTDGDGFGDGAEVAAGTNPRSRYSVPAGPPAPSSPSPVPPTVEEPKAPTAPAPAPPADTMAPQTTIDSGPTATTTGTSASFQFSSSESGSSFQCQLDSGSWASCSSPKAYSSLGLGLHTVAVKATDAAGNTDASPAARTWTVLAPTDTTAPSTAIDSGPSGTTTSTTASFQFSASESGSSFQCQLDSGSWASCSSPKAYSARGRRPHLSGKATEGRQHRRLRRDPHHRAGARPARRHHRPRRRRSTPAPRGPPRPQPASPFSSTDNGELPVPPRLRLLGLLQLAEGLRSLAVGTHTFGVKATDPAGNTGPSAATRSWTVQSEPPSEPPPSGAGCTTTLASGANLSSAISSAAGGAVICLSTGSYSVNVTKANKSSMRDGSSRPRGLPHPRLLDAEPGDQHPLPGPQFTGGIEASGRRAKSSSSTTNSPAPSGSTPTASDRATAPRSPTS